MATSVPATVTEPADGRSKPATIRSSVDLPEPLGPRTTQSSPCCTVMRQPLQRGDAALGRAVDAEEIPDLDECAHSIASTRPRHGGGECAPRDHEDERCRKHDVDHGRAENGDDVDGEHERRLGRSGPRGEADEIGDDGRESDPGQRPGDKTGDGNGCRPQPDDPAQQRRRCALGLEIEELAPLVAQIADHGQQDPGEREQERDGRRDGERDQRPVGDRVSPRVGLERSTRLDREHVERLRRQGVVDRRRAVRVTQARATPRSRVPRPAARG